jgi:regulatory protein
VITSVLGGINPAAERGRAEQLVRARLRQENLSDADDARVSRRMVAMLARRGFGQTMAYEVVTAELAAERERRRV